MSDVVQGIGKEIRPIEYLMIWTGVIGVTVGLSFPKGIVIPTRDGLG